VEEGEEKEERRKRKIREEFESVQLQNEKGRQAKRPYVRATYLPWFPPMPSLVST
jgi:hypothetical protein